MIIGGGVKNPPKKCEIIFEQSRMGHLFNLKMVPKYDFISPSGRC